MQAFRARRLRRRDDRLRVEIIVDLNRLVGEPGEARAAIPRRMQRDRLDLQPPGGGDDAAGDFAAIGDQNAGKQNRPPSNPLPRL
jgi:hypothetical protein